MSITDFRNMMSEGGWGILVGYFLYKELWPFITNKLVPVSMKNMESQRQEHATELEQERQFHRELELERSKTLSTISAAIQNLSVSMAQTNERIAAILTNQQLIISQQNATFGVLTDAVGDMKVASARRRGGLDWQRYPLMDS